MNETDEAGSMAQRIEAMKSSRVPFELLPPIPVNMLVELSNACNHACIFCTNPHMQRKIGRIENGLMEGILASGYDAGVREIGFYTTGDPLVHKELERFTREAKRLGYRYAYISTNGAAGGVERFRSVIDAGMDSIKFSINAGTRESYKLIHGRDHFDRVIDNLRFVSEYRRTLSRPLRLFVTCVVTKQIEHEKDALRELVTPFVDELVFSPCDSQQGQMLGAGPLLGFQGQPAVKGSATAVCPLPFNRLHVTYEGYLTLCCVDYQNYLAVADLKSMSLTAAWRSAEFVAARRRHLEQKLAGTLCGNCWHGAMEKVAPLVPELASPIDFDRLYADQVEVVKARLARHNG